MADKKPVEKDLGSNIRASFEGEGNTTLVLKIDLAQRLGRSKSGKTVLIASTGPSLPIPEHPNIVLGLNLYIKGE